MHHAVKVPTAGSTSSSKKAEMMNKTKQVIFSGLAGAGLLLGGYTVANATSSTTAPAVSAATDATATTEAPDTTDAPGVDNSNKDAAHEAAETPQHAADEAAGKVGGRHHGGGHDETAIVGSVAAPAEVAGQDQAAEDAALKALATTTPEQAAAAAIAAVPGTAGTPELRSESGFVIYSVVVTTASGDVTVEIDAGNAKVLGQENHGAGDHGKGGNEADETHDQGGNDAPDVTTAA